MKTFGEILEELNKERLMSHLKNHLIYSVMVDNIDYVLEQLKALEPVSTGARLKLWKDDFEDTWGAAMVRDGEVYSIDWVPWEEALGYTVDVKEIVEEVPLEEFVLMVLYDLTFDGADYTEREKKISELNSRMER